MPTSDQAPQGVLRNRRFRYLLASVAISQAGTQVTAVAVPLLAVLVLHASAFEVGLLVAAQTVAFLLIGLPAGVWVDRLPRRSMLIATDLLRTIFLLAIPVAWLFDSVPLWLLYVVVLVVGFCTVFSEIAYVGYLPSIVQPDEITSGFAAVDVAFKSTVVGGPALGGSIVRMIGAPIALTVDAFSYLVSALLVLAIPRHEPPRDSAERNVWREMGEGLGLVLRHPMLRRLAVTGALTSAFEMALLAIQPIFLLDGLAVGALEYGVVLAVGAIGGLLGAILASPVAKRLGEIRTMWLVPFVTAPFGLALPLAHRGWSVGIYALAGAVVYFGAAIYNIAQLGYRQKLCPDSLRGRMNGSMRFLMWGAMPLGGLIGGALGSIGSRLGLLLCAVGMILAYAPLADPRFRRATHVNETSPVLSAESAPVAGSAG